MRPFPKRTHLPAAVAVVAIGLVLCGCPAADQQAPPAEPPQPAAVEPESPAPLPDVDLAEPRPAPAPPGEPAVEPQVEPAVEPKSEIEPLPEAEAKRDLGPPVVDNLEDLKRLDPVKPLWIDRKNKRIVMVGEVCQTNAPLEMFACLKDTKEHEAIVTVDVKAFAVHAGLLAVGADAGGTVKWHPKYVPASGSEIDVVVYWKDSGGKIQTARAQDWILDVGTGKPMAHPWVFAGSTFWEDEQTGKKYYQAESGDFICVSNFTTAMLDLPIKSSQANSELMFMANPKVIPPLGTPVTLTLGVAEKPAPAYENK